MIDKRKGQFIFMLILLALAVVIYLLWSPKFTSVEDVTNKVFYTSPSSPEPVQTEIPVTKDGRKVLGLTPGNEDEELKNIKLRNKVSPKWDEGLRKALYKQGGSSLQRVNIQKVESLIWVHDGVALNAESVVVTLQDFKNRETSFRAMVDSESGKILQTWDQPVIDEFQKDENSGVRLDPRYEGQ